MALNVFFSRLQCTRRTLFQTQLRLYSCSALSLKPKELETSTVSLLNSSNNPDQILQICRQHAASLCPDQPSTSCKTALSVGIQKLKSLNSFEGIRAFLEEVKSLPKLRTESLVAYWIVLYGKAGMINDAISTFEKMGELGVERTVYSLNSLLYACIMAEEYEEVTTVFYYMSKKYGIEPDTDSYNNLLKGFCGLTEESLGFRVLDEMSKKGCKPNLKTFHILILKFEKERKFEELEKVLRLMKEHGIKQCAQTYNVRIKSLCKLERSDEAKALLEEMLWKGLKPSMSACCCLVDGFCMEDKLEVAKELLGFMVASECNPADECYFTLINYLCKAGDFEPAFQLLKKTSKKEWVNHVTTLKSVVEGLSSVSKQEHADGLLREIHRFPRVAVLYDTLS